MTLQELTTLVEDKIKSVVNGSASKYVSFEHPETNEDWTIRISNHGANPDRVDENTISFVVFVPEDESEDSYSALSVNKKNFKSLPNQFQLNELGDFEENFRDIEECLEYVLY